MRKPTFLIFLCMQTMFNSQEFANAYKKHRLCVVPFPKKKQFQIFKSLLCQRVLFLFSQEKGILWTTQNPFEDQIIINQDGFFKKNQSGKFEPLMANKHPDMQAFSQVFLTLFSGQANRLKKDFTVFFEKKEKCLDDGPQAQGPKTKKKNSLDHA